MNRYKAGRPSKATSSTLCQKCLKRGHYSYECTSTQQERPYVSRPSRSQQFMNPKLAPKLSATALEPKPDIKKSGSEVKAPRSPKRGRDDQEDRIDSKRRRSDSSYSSDSVSTISTNRTKSSSRSRSRSLSPPPLRSRRDRRPSSDRSAPPQNHRRDSSADRHRRHSRIRTRDRSPEERNYRRRDDSPPRRARDLSFSPSPRRRSRDGPVSRQRSRSRSPYRGARKSGRDENAGRGPPAPPNRSAPRERSLSPYSQRVAMTKAMEGS